MKQIENAHKTFVSLIMILVITALLILFSVSASAQTTPQDSIQVVDIPLGEKTKQDIEEQLKAITIAQENLSRIITYIQESHGLDSLQFVGFLPELKAVRFK